MQSTNEHPPEDTWHQAEPRQLPEPTFWPFFMALGLVLLFWGIITTVFISVTGLLIITIALVGWINLLRHE